MNFIQPGITEESTVKLLSYCRCQYLQYHFCRFTVKSTVLSLTFNIYSTTYVDLQLNQL